MEDCVLFVEIGWLVVFEDVLFGDVLIVFGDCVVFWWVVVNLIDNVIKYGDVVYVVFCWDG